MSEYVLPERNTVVLEPTDVLCRAEDHLRLLMAVHSAPGNVIERRTIRETWGKAAKEDLPGVRVIFVLGMPARRSSTQVPLSFIFLSQTLNPVLFVFLVSL